MKDYIRDNPVGGASSIYSAKQKFILSNDYFWENALSIENVQV